MPISGEQVTSAWRTRAIGQITDVLGTAAARATEAGDAALVSHARAPFSLVELSPAQARRFTERFSRAVVWTDEGNCFNRAMLGAHLLDRNLGVGAGPTSDAFVGAIAVSPHAHLEGGYTGGFHAALAIRVRGHAEPQVLDLLPGNPRMQPLSDWSVHPEPLLLRPWAGTGLWDGVANRSTWVGAQYFDFAAEQLTRTWNDAEQYGVHVASRSVVPG